MLDARKAQPGASLNPDTFTDSPSPDAAAMCADVQDRIDRLSRLNRIDYDRAREREAEELGIRVGTLDMEVQARRSAREAPEPNGQGQIVVLADPDPWPDPVDGSELLEEIEAVYDCYLVLPKGASAAFSLWTVFSHAHDAFQVSPLLGITSAEKGCGKTTAEMLLGSMVRRPLPLANITAPSLFRIVEMYGPTLLVDETDTFIFGNEGLRGVLDSGWLRSHAQIIRTVGEDHEPRIFSTWSPKAFALIGSLPASLADRSIEVRMYRQTPEEEHAKVKLRADHLNVFEYLRQQAWRWAQDNMEMLRTADPKVPEGFANRLADNWRPLLAIADLAGGEWPRRAREAAMMLSGARMDESFAVMLLEDIEGLFSKRRVDRLSSDTIVKALGEMEDRPWPEYGSNGKPITKHGVAKILRRFGVGPTTIRLGSRTPKGYRREDLENTFSRFLPKPLPLSATPQQTAPDAASADFQNATKAAHVADRKAQKPASNGPCCGVAVSKPQKDGASVREKRVLEVEV